MFLRVSIALPAIRDLQPRGFAAAGAPVFRPLMNPMNILQLSFVTCAVHWRSLRLALFSGCAALLSACGTPMPLGSDTKTLDLSQQSIVLFTLQQTRAEDRTMPWPRSLQVVDMTRNKAEVMKVDTTWMEYGEDSRRYVTPLRLALPAGKYSLAALNGTIQAFPLSGMFWTPLGLQFEVQPRSVTYVGRLCVHMRPRLDTEYRAGALLPLVSQAALGISTSTFDVQVKDSSAADLPIFRDAFPVLKEFDIRTQLLSQQDRFSLDREFGATQPSNSPAVACQ